MGKYLESERLLNGIESRIRKYLLTRNISLTNPIMIFFSQVRQLAALQLVDLDTAETFRWDIDINWEQDILNIRAGLQISWLMSQDCPLLLADLVQLRGSICFKSLFVPGVCCPDDPFAVLQPQQGQQQGQQQVATISQHHNKHTTNNSRESKHQSNPFLLLHLQACRPSKTCLLRTLVQTLFQLRQSSITLSRAQLQVTYVSKRSWTVFSFVCVFLTTFLAFSSVRCCKGASRENSWWKWNIWGRGKHKCTFDWFWLFHV